MQKHNSLRARQQHKCTDTEHYNQVCTAHKPALCQSTYLFATRICTQRWDLLHIITFTVFDSKLAVASACAAGCCSSGSDVLAKSVCSRAPQGLHLKWLSNKFLSHHACYRTCESCVDFSFQKVACPITSAAPTQHRFLTVTALCYCIEANIPGADICTC